METQLRLYHYDAKNVEIFPKKYLTSAHKVELFWLWKLSSFWLWKLLIVLRIPRKNCLFDKISKKVVLHWIFSKKAMSHIWRFSQSESISKKSPYFDALYLLSLCLIWLTYKEILRQRHENRLLCYYLYSIEESLVHFSDENHLHLVLLKSNFLL